MRGDKVLEPCDECRREANKAGDAAAELTAVVDPDAG